MKDMPHIKATVNGAVANSLAELVAVKHSHQTTITLFYGWNTCY